MLSWGFRSGSGTSSVIKGSGVALGIATLLTGLMPDIATAVGQPSGEQFSGVQLAQAAPGGNNESNEDVIVGPEPTDSTTPRTGTPSTTATGTRFTCQAMNGQYIVMYQPESQPGQSYAWANPTTMGGGWTPERRCNEISRRLESYRPDGLVEMRTAVENGYNTVCVTTQAVPGCRIVLTVPAGQDPLATRDSVFQNLTIADGGQQTQAVNTYVGGRGDGIVGQIGQILGGLPDLGRSSRSSGAINLRPFLDRADGGTAQNLRGGSPRRPAPRLNPNNFR